MMLTCGGKRSQEDEENAYNVGFAAYTEHEKVLGPGGTTTTQLRNKGRGGGKNKSKHKKDGGTRNRSINNKERYWGIEYKLVEPKGEKRGGKYRRPVGKNPITEFGGGKGSKGGLDNNEKATPEKKGKEWEIQT